jgi:transposase-like protein
MKKASRKKFSSEFKAKVAIDAIKEQKTIADLAIQYEVHPTQIQHWKKQFIDNAQLVFGDTKTSLVKDADQESRLYEQIGKLQVQNEWLKKKLS